MSDHSAAIGSMGVGIIAAGTWAIISLYGGLNSLGVGGTTIAVGTVVLPFGYALNLISQEQTSSNDSTAHGHSDIKSQTEQWSEEATINPAFPPSQDPSQSSVQTQGTSTPQQAGSNEQDTQAPYTADDQARMDQLELDFHWQEETDVDFEDIGGMEELKGKLRTEVIKPLERPEKAQQLGVSTPNILFHGPPGTGKTFTAQALATELGLPFAKLSGADVQSKWINESAGRVNDLFNEARKVAALTGGAIIFLDELDSVLKDRSGNESAHEEDTKVVNEFLSHLEETKDHNIVFIGATNRIDSLDEAGIRSGRIDQKIHVGKPDAAARTEILHAQLADRPHSLNECNIEKLAATTDGAVAADLEALVEDAAKAVLSRDGSSIQMSDFHRGTASNS